MRILKILTLLFFVLVWSFGCSTIEPASVTPNEDNPTVEEKENDKLVQTPNDENISGDNLQPTNEDDPSESTPPVETPPLVEYYVGKHHKIYPVDETLKDEKITLLTIDDSPKDAEVTKQILDILDKHNAKAIFFVNGIYVKKNPDMLIEIHKRGHIIGNHSYTHPNFRNGLSDEEQRKEILDVQTQIEELIGERPTFFRPPHGAYTEVSNAVMKEEKMQSMNWSVGSLDWELKNPEDVVNQVLTTMHNGANILFHDKQITADALDKILTELESKGYSYVLPTKTVVE